MKRTIVVGLLVCGVCAAGLWAGAGITVGGISNATALASVALIGYLMGRSQLARNVRQEGGEAEQTQAMIEQLDTVSKQIRRSLAMQHASIRVFREKVRALCDVEDRATREMLVAQAERILQPTAELSSEIVHAYDTIRRETGVLRRLQNQNQNQAVESSSTA